MMPIASVKLAQFNTIVTGMKTSFTPFTIFIVFSRIEKCEKSSCSHGSLDDIFVFLRERTNQAGLTSRTLETEREWQDCEYVLRLFAKKLDAARDIIRNT